MHGDNQEYTILADSDIYLDVKNCDDSDIESGVSSDNSISDNVLATSRIPSVYKSYAAKKDGLMF